ncbi:MAG: hypothetical protein DRI90_15700, partial [Deltaproteobacteria bacterium]
RALSRSCPLRPQLTLCPPAPPPPPAPAVPPAPPPAPPCATLSEAALIAHRSAPSHAGSVSGGLQGSSSVPPEGCIDTVT